MHSVHPCACGLTRVWFLCMYDNSYCIVALMRRAIARHKLKQLEEAKEDLELLLKQQPHHKKAKELHETIQNELAKTTTKRRLKIEEVSESPEEVQPQPSASHDTSGSPNSKPPESHDAKPPGSHDAKPLEVPLPVQVIKLKDMQLSMVNTITSDR